jgi:hypothetical protein
MGEVYRARDVKAPRDAGLPREPFSGVDRRLAIRPRRIDVEGAAMTVLLNRPIALGQSRR